MKNGILILMISILLNSCAKLGLVDYSIVAGKGGEGDYYNGKPIDLNNDGKVDFSILITYGVSIQMADTTFEVATEANNEYSPLKIPEGKTIDKKNHWAKQRIVNGYITGFMFTGSFHLNTSGLTSYYDYWGKDAGFVGVRQQYKKGKYKYGWIKVGVSDTYKYTIYDWAFNK
ncbi:MAG: hypothetical protein NTX03_05880 [Bacteroidetes bacterium]|nr:hypothetical protein [Bacteroidota bacterium]